MRANPTTPPTVSPNSFEPSRGYGSAAVDRRLAAVRLALLGRTAVQIAGDVLLSRPIRIWAVRFKAGGPDALADRPSLGGRHR